MSEAKLYKITHVPSGKYYIGITFGAKMSVERRFKEHMAGKGGIRIKMLLDEGFTERDFTVEEIDYGPLEHLYSREAELSVMWPEGLNQNKGNAIIQTEEGTRTAVSKRAARMSETRIKISMTLSGLDRETTIENLRKKDEKRAFLDSMTEEERKNYDRLKNKEKGEKRAKAAKERKELIESMEYPKIPDDIRRERFKQSQSEMMTRVRKEEDDVKKLNRKTAAKLAHKNMSEEEKQARIEKISATKKSKSDEISKKSKEYHAGQTEEQRIARGNSISNGIRKYLTSLSEEQYLNYKDTKSRIVSNYFRSLTEDQLAAHGKSSSDGRRKAKNERDQYDSRRDD